MSNTQVLSIIQCQKLVGVVSALRKLVFRGYTWRSDRRPQSRGLRISTNQTVSLTTSTLLLLLLNLSSLTTDTNTMAEPSPATSETTNEEELRKLLKPVPTVEQILEVVQAAFLNADGVDIKVVKELESYDDKNLWIRFSGNDWLVKVHNGVESKDLIERLDASSAKRKHEESCSSSSSNEHHKKSAIHLQNAMMMHLHENGIMSNYPQDPQQGDYVHAPTPVSVHSLPVVSKAHSPCKLVVRLLSWVDGRPMSAFPMLPLEALADAGRFLGKLSVCLSSLKTDELTACKRYHQWDGKNTADLRDFVQYIDGDQRKVMVTSVIDAFQTELIDSKVAETKFQKALIHADFNDANVLLDDNFCVSGVIDFGDSVERYDPKKKKADCNKRSRFCSLHN